MMGKLRLQSVTLEHFISIAQAHLSKLLALVVALPFVVPPYELQIFIGYQPGCEVGIPWDLSLQQPGSGGLRGTLRCPGHTLGVAMSASSYPGGFVDNAA